MVSALLTSTMIAWLPLALEDGWSDAQHNAERSQLAIKFCRRYAYGWLSHADPKSGLLPRTTTGQDFWNAKDCAADNYPFIVLTAYLTDDYHLKQIAHHILEQERRLTRGLDSLPEDFMFATQALRVPPSSPSALIFGASEYAKDGLMPIFEWIGPGPWLNRMEDLIRDIWKNAKIETKSGLLPSTNEEVCGELLQTMSRLFWLRRNPQYREWVFRLADHFLLASDWTEQESMRLRDHGCEILGGLSEAYVLAAELADERRDRYRPILHRTLDRILEKGVNEDGMMPNAFNPKTGQVTASGLSDGWGYVYNAFLTVASLDRVQRYEEAVRHALTNIHKYKSYAWEGTNGADGYADSIEGALNLLQRIRIPSAFEWVDEEIQFLFNKQRHDGILEGWYGDGNSARTVMMYALLKTQGITLSPWREDLQLGAIQDADGRVRVFIQSEWPWRGHLRFDQVRHRDVLQLPFDYARINQFPEWCSISKNESYVWEQQGREPRLVSGEELLRFEFNTSANRPVRFSLRPLRDQESFVWRSQKYSTRSKDAAIEWQSGLRKRLFNLLKMSDLLGEKPSFAAKELSSQSLDAGYVLKEIEINSTEKRRIRVLLTEPKSLTEPRPAVVCIHGHGGNRKVVHDEKSIYKGFAARLAAQGYVTIAIDVGQHSVAEANRTLMGERLWDLMRCVDYLESLETVDRTRIGSGGLSLGGEMGMWLGALDERILATVSSGFLTTMDQMEQNHCMCWKFPGLRELVDYADIYSLIAPRALQCQNGLREGPRDFFVPLAQRAMKEIEVIYEDFNRRDGVELAVHPGGHEIDLPALTRFFDQFLGLETNDR